MSDDDFIVLTRSPERDPDGSKFKAAITSHFACEKARLIREFLVSTLALTSILVWPLAAWAYAVSSSLRALILAAWAVCSVLALGAKLTEWRWRRLRARHASDVRPSPGTMRR